MGLADDTSTDEYIRSRVEIVNVKLGEHGGVYPIKQTDEPCTTCGKEIQPGQLYVPDGPRHLGCK
jgi:hypothetical protein